MVGAICIDLDFKKNHRTLAVGAYIVAWLFVGFHGCAKGCSEG